MRASFWSGREGKKCCPSGRIFFLLSPSFHSKTPEEHTSELPNFFFIFTVEWKHWIEFCAIITWAPHKSFVLVTEVWNVLQKRQSTEKGEGGLTAFYLLLGAGKKHLPSWLKERARQPYSSVYLFLVPHFNSCVKKTFEGVRWVLPSLPHDQVFTVDTKRELCCKHPCLNIRHVWMR